ncbi:MAG: restriction endonuclease subunit S [Saccharofermentanales bacterium]
MTGRSGTIGKVMFEKEDFWPLNTSLWVKDFHKNDPKFIYYLLTNFDFTSFNNGTSVPTLNRNDVHSVEFSIPKIEEQTAIASILSAIDDKIELNLQTNKTLEEMAMALYKHWFVDFGPFREGEFVDSELGRIPKGWEVKSIGEIVKIIGGYAFKSKDFSNEGEKVIKIKNISNNVVTVQGSDCIPSTVAAKTNFKFKIKPGSYLIAMTGAEVGKVGIVPDYYESLWLNQRVGMIVEPEFEFADILVGNFLQSEECYEIIQNLAYGSAQPNISSSGLEGITLFLPNDISIIKSFLENLKNWDQLKVDNYTENLTLTALRDTLLPKLISGEVRVKDFAQT